MGKIVSVASQYTIYEVPDEAIELLSNGTKTLPPAIVLETLVLNGQAARIGTVGTMTVNVEDFEGHIDDDDDEPPEGAGPWLEEDD